MKWIRPCEMTPPIHREAKWDTPELAGRRLVAVLPKRPCSSLVIGARFVAVGEAKLVAVSASRYLRPGHFCVLMCHC